VLGWIVLTSINYSSPAAGTSDPGVMHDVLLRMLILVPVGCAVLQLALWRFFTLKGSYLKKVKICRASKYVV